MRSRLRFLLNGQLEEIDHCLPTDTVLDYLREKRKLVGTKEGCAEGDCGACTVVLAEEVNGQMKYQAVNACILFLPALDGKHLITVEGLQEASDLHPVQQAMVDQHASQCGFCTPGFVMSMFAMYHDSGAAQPSTDQINAHMAGNLCRCTGYVPISQAAEQSLRKPGPDKFDRDETDFLKQLGEIRSEEMLCIGSEERRFFAPLILSELCAVMKDNPSATLVAGATDVGLWVTKQLREFDTLVYTGRCRELLQIVKDKNSATLSIGAAVSYSDAMPALLEAYPELEEMMTRLGGMQVRNAGTIGGNIANGSPIGDMPPALIVLGAKLEISSSAGKRTIPLEDFFIDYGKQDLQPGECVSRVVLPLRQDNQLIAVYKISKRFEQDISAVCAAFSVELADGKVKASRIAYGGMAAVPKRATACEAALKGALWNELSVIQAMDALEEDFSPISDMRATADYRMKVARNLLKRFYLESTDQSYPIRLAIS